VLAWFGSLLGRLELGEVGLKLVFTGWEFSEL
jgi:hypothetical protein